MNRKLSHIDERGRAQMVGVGDKPVTHRVCVARGEVRMAAETLACIAEGRVPKGDVLLTARLAGIGAAKRTDEWIPLCHSLPLDIIEIELTPDPAGPCVLIQARVETHARTGVEMEALLAADSKLSDLLASELVRLSIARGTDGVASVLGSIAGAADLSDRQVQESRCLPRRPAQGGVARLRILFPKTRKNLILLGVNWIV